MRICQAEGRSPSSWKTTPGERGWLALQQRVNTSEKKKKKRRDELGKSPALDTVTNEPRRRETDSTRRGDTSNEARERRTPEATPTKASAPFKAVVLRGPPRQRVLHYAPMQAASSCRTFPSPFPLTLCVELNNGIRRFPNGFERMHRQRIRLNTRTLVTTIDHQWVCAAIQFRDSIFFFFFWKFSF